MDIVDNSGKWWQAKKADGTTGSEYFDAQYTRIILMISSHRSCSVELPAHHLGFVIPILHSLSISVGFGVDRSVSGRIRGLESLIYALTYWRHSTPAGTTSPH